MKICDVCGGLIGEPGEAIAGTPCKCLLPPAPGSQFRCRCGNCRHWKSDDRRTGLCQYYQFQTYEYQGAMCHQHVDAANDEDEP
jgi:hypothetical protein